MFWYTFGRAEDNHKFGNLGFGSLAKIKVEQSAV
jgi:hypothetical protein